ncbi:unannotated protein [freshwater metagenome]|uniref:Unannotated protein n=1 Tax=freshwater metagenome TaxID=449393 RepID=A0A6J6BRX9_9ZZZZ
MCLNVVNRLSWVAGDPVGGYRSTVGNVSGDTGDHVTASTGVSGCPTLFVCVEYRTLDAITNLVVEGGDSVELRNVDLGGALVFRKPTHVPALTDNDDAWVNLV